MMNIVSDPEETPSALVLDLSSDGGDCVVAESECLCLKCHKQGVTRLLLSKIPFYREVVISSFHCDLCGYSDRSIQSGGAIQDKGVQFTLSVVRTEDLNRQIVRSDFASFALPELEFEQIPSKKGEINTVEGLLDSAVAGLQLKQNEAMKADPENAAKIDGLILKVKKLKELESPFTLVINDPTGNSFVESPQAPHKDDQLLTVRYTRSHQQDVDISIAAEDENEAATAENELDLNLTNENIRNQDFPEDDIHYFMDVTDSDAATALQFLESCAGDLETALENFRTSEINKAVSRAKGPEQRKRRMSRSDDSDHESTHVPRHSMEHRGCLGDASGLLVQESFAMARLVASEADKWLLAFVNKEGDFQSQVMNNSVWSNEVVQELVRERLIFWQANSNSESGRSYIDQYGIDRWPHVAILDPRTGQMVACWEKVGPESFIESANEFLARNLSPNTSDMLNNEGV